MKINQIKNNLHKKKIRTRQLKLATKEFTTKGHNFAEVYVVYLCIKSE